MRDCIYITDADCEKLRRLIAGLQDPSRSDRAHLESLEQELDRAEVVAPEAIPPDVVTMNSEVRVEDLDTGVVERYKLVFPSEFRWDHSISVLAPVGTALLGYRVGDRIEWRVPKGLRRLKILEILYQPEAAGTRA